MSGETIPDEVVIAAIETVLRPLGSSLRHYMPMSKTAAIEAMRGVLMAERYRFAKIADGFAAGARSRKDDVPADSPHAQMHRTGEDS